MKNIRNVAILIFDEVEVLDFCGPLEVFSIVGHPDGRHPMNVFTVAEKATIAARNKLSVNPSFNFTDCPLPDILVVPGGGGYHADGTPFGSRREMHNKALLEWLCGVVPTTQHTLSVCTGALILANAGLTQNLKATTHHHAFDALRETDPSLDVLEDQRIVDNGQLIFSGGISAGIDASFHLVEKAFGREIADETATYMEYNRQSEFLRVEE